MDTDRPEAYRLLAVSRSSEALEDLLHMGMLTGSRHTDFVKGASGLVSAHKASDSWSRVA